jgi:hypothetical protein
MTKRKLGRRLPRRGTRAPPGSARKIEVLAGRWARGELLHHPADVREVVWALAGASAASRRGH